MTQRLFLPIVLGCAASAFAQSVPTASQSQPTSGDQIQSLANFWTPERLAAARPMPLPQVDPASVAVANAPSMPGASGVIAGGRPSVPPAPVEQAATERFPLNQDSGEDTAGTPSPTGFNYEMPFNNYRTGINNEYPYSTIGKLFFVIPAGASEPAGEYVCSGAVALNNHTVVTARHCVFDYVSQKWYGSWVFYPGWNDGSNSALGGAWYVNFAYTWVGSSTASLTSGGWDIALLSMHDSTGTGCGGDKGKTIGGSYTGWLGAWYGENYSQVQFNIFGYPQEAPFEGNYLYQDNGATGALNPNGSSGIVEVGNPQTGGTSGGPWIVGFNPNNATDPSPNNTVGTGNFNMVNGVNSFQWTNPSQPYAINGPEFEQSNFWNLYTDYQTVTCS